MTSVRLLEKAAELYQRLRVEESLEHFRRTKTQVDDENKFKKLLKHPELENVRSVLQLLQEHTENDDWIAGQKKLYGPLVEHELRAHVAKQRAQTDPALVPRLSWRQQLGTTRADRQWLEDNFWAKREEKWREEATNSMLAQAKDELQGRMTELANLQVRLSLVLTLTTALLAIVSLGSQQRSTWTVALATIVGCMVLGIALIPMRSNRRQAWVNKHVDAIVWAIQAIDPVGRMCILRRATEGRNAIIARYKRWIWSLVVVVTLALGGVAALNVPALLTLFS